jgi:multiple antibiotic resistance protein
MIDLPTTTLLASLAGSAALSFFVQSFVALFVVVDPIGNVPIFLTLLQRFEEGERRTIVRRAVLVAFSALLLVTLSGNAFFAFLGIKLYSFRIAGGILLTIVSIEMLFGKKTRTESPGEEERTYGGQDDISVLPLAIPILTGPGAFTTGIVLFDTAGGLVNRIILVLTVMIVYALCYVILLRSWRVFKYLGKTGTTVAIRIMGLMLLSLAVQFIVGGLADAFPHLQ